MIWATTTATTTIQSWISMNKYWISVKKCVDKISWKNVQWLHQQSHKPCQVTCIKRKIDSKFEFAWIFLLFNLCDWNVTVSIYIYQQCHVFYTFKKKIFKNRRPEMIGMSVKRIILPLCSILSSIFGAIHFLWS